MKISIYGAGYVGLVSAACLAKLGHQVTCADINQEKISMLRRGECPIYEEHLPELLHEQSRIEQLFFTSNLAEAIAQADIHLIATGTPSLPDGSADLSQVFAVARQVAEHVQKDGVLVTKSTVPVGTGDAIQSLVEEELAKRGKALNISVASNPEFLREGTAVNDFLKADRIVIGGDRRALEALKRMYHPLVEQGIPLLCMGRTSAELSKYAANAMLASRISFINHISQLAEAVGANIDEVREGMSLDTRIGPHFLQPGIGYGGSCFPKDVRALIQVTKAKKLPSELLEAIDEVNREQKNWVFKKLAGHFNNHLEGLTIAIWGLSFKPGTDDIREASSLVAIQSLREAGATLRLFDPVAMPVAKKILTNDPEIVFCESAEGVFDENLDALVIATEWPDFKQFDLKTLRDRLGKAPIIDGRNCFDLETVAAAELTYYYSVGRPLVKSQN
nr:nucleotide sugar dehydrogenase [Legionella jordanis]